MPRDASTESEDAVDAVDLLTRDHQLIEQLLTAVEQAAPQQIDPLARRLCKMLRVHAQIEEELFYPIARRGADAALVDGAERDHREAKQTIARVESMNSNDERFKPTVLELASQVRAHVTEEEQQIFPRMRDASVNLTALGLTLAERRDTLLDTLGLHGDDEEGARNQREIQRARKENAQREDREQ